MNIFAQHGFGPSDKLVEGCRQGHIQGVVFSPRYVTPEKIQSHLNELRPFGTRFFFDPEYYASEFLSHPNPNLGNLEAWSSYFQRPRRTALISGKGVPSVLHNTFSVQQDLGLTEWISPNVYIHEANSIETGIAMNMITQAKGVAADLGESSVYATLAIHRDALLESRDFQDILDALTSIDSPPDGYYIIVGSSEMNSSGSHIRSDLYHPQVIAGWMYMNYVMSINGARVLNGFVHQLSPLLAICGGESTAHGWSSGLKKFCINRYVRQPPGGRSPRIRYANNTLVSYLLQTEMAQYIEVIPELENGLSLDVPYREGEPSRTEAAQQSWEALGALCGRYEGIDMLQSLDRFSQHLETAMTNWYRLREAGFSLEIEANIERLQSMKDGIQLFKEWAELA
jgi:hypothetical protein